MKFVYPAVFRKTASGTYRAFFPDLEDCQAEGETLDDVELTEDGELPSISDHSDLILEKGDEIRNISVNIRFTDGWDE